MERRYDWSWSLQQLGKPILIIKEAKKIIGDVDSTYLKRRSTAFLSDSSGVVQTGLPNMKTCQARYCFAWCNRLHGKFRKTFPGETGRLTEEVRDKKYSFAFRGPRCLLCFLEIKDLLALFLFLPFRHLCSASVYFWTRAVSTTFVINWTTCGSIPWRE